MRIWLHPHLRAEAPEKIDVAIAALGRALQAPAGRSRGVKALRGPWPGTLRLRFAGVWRAIFSTTTSPQGQREAWLHCVDQRKQIYDREASLARVVAWSQGRLGLGYLPVEVDPPETVGDEALLPLLSADQEAFVSSLLPLRGARSGALVHLAHGPPGSGKSVVAADAAREAHETDHDVLIVVPSGKLQRRFREALGPLVTPDPIAGGSADGVPRIWIERAPDLFAGFVQTSGPTLIARWPALLQAPPLQRWRRAHPIVESLRFIELFDATFDDPAANGDRSKDALAAQDRPLRAALQALEGAPAAHLREALVGAPLRWQRARAARAALAGLRPGRDLVILVDEAQDLVPAEWQTLMEAARDRRDKGWRTALALLGDENQRITPTAFSWGDVKEHLTAIDPASREGISQSTLPGSFRVPRVVAQAAAPFMDGRLDPEGSRRAALADPDRIADEGHLRVVIAEAPAQALALAASQLQAEGVDGRLVVLCAAPLLPHPLIDALDVVEAKGLEWERVVLLDLLPTPLDYNARARAYTRITRAKQRLLVLLRPDEWVRIGPLWEGLGPAATGEEALPGLLREALNQDPDALERELLDRLSNRLDEAEASGAPFPLAAFALSRRLVEHGAGAALVGFLDELWDRRPDWEAALATLPPEQAPLGALLRGDAGAAWALARQVGDPALEEPLAAMLSQGDRLGLASAALRRDGAAAAPLPDLAVRALHRQIRARWVAEAPPEPPTSPPTGQSRLARAVAQSLEAHVSACQVALEALQQRLAAALPRRIPAPNPPDLRALHGLSARAEALLQRFGPAVEEGSKGHTTLYSDGSADER